MAVIAGRQFRLWRAVDDEGEVLDLLVQRRRDKAAAVKLMRKLLKKQGFAPDVRWLPDKLRSYGVAKSKLDCRLGMSKVEEEQSSREFTSTDTTMRAEDATLQIARISPTFLVRSCRRPKRFQHSTPSHLPPHPPRLPRRSVPDVASCDGRMNSKWVVTTSHGHFQVHVTVSS